MEDQRILEMLAAMASQLRELFPVDSMIGVTDREKFLAYTPAQESALDLRKALGRDVVGLPLPPGDAITLAVQTGQRQAILVPQEAFGVPFKAIGLPIRNSRGEIIGGLGLGVSLRHQHELEETARHIEESAQQIDAASEEVAQLAIRLAEGISALSSLGKTLSEEISRTNNILGFVKGVARTSNLLGLNAAIEAARAGDAGKGFSVVASEVRQLSQESVQAVEEIKKVLDSVQAMVDAMRHKIDNLETAGHTLAANSEESRASTEQLTASIANIEQAAKIL